MGCGGSRADAIEPRYYESWTRETESTWLTNTDAAAESQPPPPPLEASGHDDDDDDEQVQRGSGILGDTKSTQTCTTKSSTTSGIVSTEKKTYCGTQGTKPVANVTGASEQKQQNGFRTREDKWESKKKKLEKKSLLTPPKPSGK